MIEIPQLYFTLTFTIRIPHTPRSTVSTAELLRLESLIRLAPGGVRGRLRRWPAAGLHHGAGGNAGAATHAQRYPNGKAAALLAPQSARSRVFPSYILVVCVRRSTVDVSDCVARSGGVLH